MGQEFGDGLARWFWLEECVSTTSAGKTGFIYKYDSCDLCYQLWGQTCSQKVIRKCILRAKRPNQPCKRGVPNLSWETKHLKYCGHPGYPSHITSFPPPLHPMGNQFPEWALEYESFLLHFYCNGVFPMQFITLLCRLLNYFELCHTACIFLWFAFSTQHDISHGNTVVHPLFTAV